MKRIRLNSLELDVNNVLSINERKQVLGGKIFIPGDDPAGPACLCDETFPGSGIWVPVNPKCTYGCR